MNFLDACGGLEPIVRLIKNGVLPVLYIGIGIVLVVLIIIDIAKAIVAGDEKEVKAAQKSAIRRLIYGIAIFFVVALVNLVFNLLGSANNPTNPDDPNNINVEQATSWWACWDSIK